MSLTSFANLLPLAVVVIASIALIFCPLVAFALKRYGESGFWVTYWAFLFLISVSCIYKLSGLSRGVHDWGNVAYWSLVFLFELGIQLTAGVIAIHHFISERSYSFPRATALGWMTSVAFIPVGLIASFLLELSIVMIARKILS